MIETSRPLTVDEAVAEFTAMVDDVLGDVLPGGAATPETPQEADTRHFLLAQHLIGLACPRPSACRDQRCRRDASCRHLAYVQSRWRARRSGHPRRPPGADILRHAIWLYVTARRRGEGRALGWG
jgi:hypothetical protein